MDASGSHASGLDAKYEHDICGRIGIVNTVLRGNIDSTVTLFFVAAEIWDSYDMAVSHHGLLLSIGYLSGTPFHALM